MAVRTSHAVGSDTERIYASVDARTAMGALWTPGADAVKARSGFRFGPGALPGLVAATGSPDANVHVNPFVYVMNSSRVAGPYELVLDAQFSVDILVGHPADPSNPRKDLIIAQQNDAIAGDADSVMRVKQVVGTPSGSPVIPTVPGSPDYIVLATITIPALATTITGAMIANTSPIVFTAAVGGLLPVFTATERNALTAYDSMAIYRLDQNWIEIYDGAAWRVQDVAIVSTVANLSLITDPVSGQLAVVSADGYIRRWTGATWRLAAPSGVPVVPVTTASAGTVTVGTTETRDAILGNYVFTGVAGHRYRAHLAGRQISGTVTGDRFAVRIRNGGASTPTSASTLVADDAFVVQSASNACDVSKTFVPGAGTQTLSVFAVRLSGTGTVQLVGGCELYVEHVGDV